MRKPDAVVADYRTWEQKRFESIRLGTYAGYDEKPERMIRDDYWVPSLEAIESACERLRPNKALERYADEHKYGATVDTQVIHDPRDTPLVDVPWDDKQNEPDHPCWWQQISNET